MTDFIEVQEKLYDKLVSLGEFHKFSVYDGAIPSGEDLISTQGRYWPYVVVGFGGKTEATSYMQGITSSAEDVKWTAFVMFVVGDTAGTVRRLKHLLRQTFEGYVPDSTWGQLVEVLTGDYGISKPDPDLIPLRFGETMAFRAMTVPD